MEHRPSGEDAGISGAPDTPGQGYSPPFPASMKSGVGLGDLVPGHPSRRHDRPAHSAGLTITRLSPPRPAGSRRRIPGTQTRWTRPGPERRLLRAYPVKILEKKPSVDGMADLRVPLDAVEALTGRRYRLHTTDGPTLQAGQTLPAPPRPRRHATPRPGSGQGSPAGYRYVRGYQPRPRQTRRLRPADCASPGRRDDVQPKTDAEDREAEVQVVGGNPGAVQGRAAAEDDTPATPAEIGRRRIVCDHCGRNIHITEHPLYQVVKLPVIVDHI